MNTSENISFIASGTQLLTEGTQGGNVFVIVSGQVKVTRKSSENHDVLLAELGEGQVFGEMSLIDHGLCSATVTTTTDTQVRILNKEQFFKLLQKDAESVQSIMEILFKRMRAMNKRVIDLEKQITTLSAQNEPEKSNSILIKGLTEPAKHALYDMNSLVVDEFPYKIGRWSKKESQKSWFSSARTKNHVEIHDIPPYVVSRQHCQIEKDSYGVYITDTSSRLGTWVNGEKIGNHSQKKIQLNSGENTVHIGDNMSHFAFQVIVP